LGFDLNMFSWC